jgi:Tfp pilus assembly protein PilF
MSANVDAFQKHLSAGNALLSAGDARGAEREFFKAASIAPEGWFAVGMSLMKQGEEAAALRRFEETLALTKAPKVRCACLNNIGMVLANRGQNAEALAAFSLAETYWPECPDTHSNIGLVEMWNGNLAAALQKLNLALKLDPWHEAAQFIRSMVHLLRCDYAQGWQEYECRWRSKSNALRKVESNFPEWDGTNGKRLLIYGEQGHGDSILALRYARELRARGMWQSWGTHAALKPLLQTMPEVDHVFVAGGELPDFDCHIPAVSLPRLLGTTIENIPSTPYIPIPKRCDCFEFSGSPKPDPMCPRCDGKSAWNFGSGFHVGIVWRGSAVNKNDLFRSTNLSMWSEVLKVDGVTFHSLQVDGAEEALLYPQILTYEKPKDWLETAQRIAALDLVIAVDTGVVHLCGAMGVPCWCILHSRPYFVFPPSFGDVTPWYSSVKLFRAAKEFEWQPVFEKVAKELCSLTKL